MSRRAASSSRREEGTASVELIAVVPFLLLAVLVAAQIALAGQALWSASVAARAGARAAAGGGDPVAAAYAMTLADGAAEAGALALASGGSAAEAAREALPGWAKDDVAVAVEGDTVSVQLRPPSPIPAVSKRLTISSSATARSAR